MASTTDFETTIGRMADFYGVDLPAGFAGDEPVRVYRDADGWHVGATVTGPAVDGLTDAEWAPRDDETAEALRG